MKYTDTLGAISRSSPPISKINRPFNSGYTNTENTFSLQISSQAHDEHWLTLGFDAHDEHWLTLGFDAKV